MLDNNEQIAHMHMMVTRASIVRQLFQWKPELLTEETTATQIEAALKERAAKYGTTTPEDAAETLEDLGVISMALAVCTNGPAAMVTCFFLEFVGGCLLAKQTPNAARWYQFKKGNLPNLKHADFSNQNIVDANIKSVLQAFKRNPAVHTRPIVSAAVH